jgi:AcrR family transcriptional regulator
MLDKLVPDGGVRMSGRKQFDVDAALERAMTAFWEGGFAATSLDRLTAVTGLGRGSLYGTFGSKDELFRSALQRYADRYGERFDAALEKRREDPAGAIKAFFGVTLDRIADRSVPGGCLVAQSAVEAPTLSPESRELVRVLLARQHARVRSVLRSAGLRPAKADELTELVVAVNQSLAVLSRAGSSARELRSVVRATCAAVGEAIRCAGSGAAARVA